MNLVIRPITIEDAKYISEIKRMDGVLENTQGIISERFEDFECRIKNLTNNDHVLVAEVQEVGLKKVAGMIWLRVGENPRKRHIGEIVVFVHKNYQRKGIGKTLFSKMIDLADNWLMLIRLELRVFTDNEKAINLYKLFGFEIEGLNKYASVRNGKYEDLYTMARCKNIIQ